MNNPKRFLRVALLALTVALAGCQTIKPTKPKTGDFKPEPARQISTVAVPISISAQAITAIVEDRMPPGSRLYWVTGQPMGDFDLQLGVHKAGAVSVSSEGGCLNLGIVLYIQDGRIDWDAKVGFIKVRKHFDFGGSARVTARVCPSVTPDWKLAATIEPNFSWVEGAYITIGTPIGSKNIAIASRVEPAIREKLPAMTAGIVEALGRLPLKEKLESAWAAIQKPILLAKNPADPPVAGAPVLPEVYLMAEPTMLGLGPLQSQGSEIVAMPIVSTYLQLHLGQPDAASVPAPRPLPGNAGAILPRGIYASVMAVVPYDEANKVAERALRDKPIEFGDKLKVAIKGIEVYPDGDRLLVKADFAGRLSKLPFDDTEGHLYLRGTPRYNNLDRTISVEDLDFDVDTKNLLVKSAELLKNPLILRALEKALRFELGPKVDPLIARAKEGVASKKIADGVLLNALATSVELSALHVGPKAMKVSLNLKGEANVVVVDPAKP